MDIRQVHVGGPLTLPCLEPPDYISQLEGSSDPDLLLCFASPDCFRNPKGIQSLAKKLKQRWPKALIMGCSTAGEITRDGVFDQSLALTGISFTHTRLRMAVSPILHMDDSFRSGMHLGRQLESKDAENPLVAVLLLGPGTEINGSALVEGISESLQDRPLIIGALAGDGTHFGQTHVLCGESIHDRHVVAVGFYGKRLHVQSCSRGGWTPFGPVRRVTRSRDNILFELDGRPALDVYRRYLGDLSNDLPGSGLLFPLAIVTPDSPNDGIIRTLLAVHEQEGSLVLAGNIPEGCNIRLMHADTTSLIQGAKNACELALKEAPSPALAMLFSCVGRRLIMGGRVDEEVEVVAQQLEATQALTGFYSYGEIGPQLGTCSSSLHNQTMTIALFKEID